MLKKSSLSSMTLLTLTLIATTLLYKTSTSADTTPTSQNVSSKLSQDISDSERQELRSLSNRLNWNSYLNGDLNPDTDEMLVDYEVDPRNVAETQYVSINNDMVLKDGDDLAAHTANLDNETDLEQTMQTAGFEYSNTDSVATTLTHSAGVDVTTKAEMKFPIASGSMSMDVSYKFSDSKTTTSSVSTKWTVPSQSIKVPAHHHFKLNWLLKTGVATGTAALTNRVSANVPFVKRNGTIIGYNLYDAITTERYLEQQTSPLGTMEKWESINLWEPLDVDGVKTEDGLRKLGDSTYTAKYGTELDMQILDVSTTNAAPVLVKTIRMNVTPTFIK